MDLFIEIIEKFIDKAFKKMIISFYLNIYMQNIFIYDGNWYNSKNHSDSNCNNNYNINDKKNYLLNVVLIFLVPLKFNEVIKNGFIN